VLLAIVACVPASGAPASGAPAHATGERPAAIPGIEWSGGRAVAFTHYEPTSLRPVGRRVPLAGLGYRWSFSPGRRLLAVTGSGERSRLGDSLRVLDVRAGTVVMQARTGTGDIVGTIWVTPTRVVAAGRSCRARCSRARTCRAGSSCSSPARARSGR
jgi:hypothetical protein